MKRVRCSIVITCYNQRDFIRDAVESALLQRADEVIVVDDASDDGSSEILQAYGDAIALTRMPRNGGVARARNRGVSMASGDYLVFLDGDDVLMPWALEVYRRIVQQLNPVLILGSTLWFRGSVPLARLKEIGRGPVTFVEYAVPMAKDRSAELIASALVVRRSALLDVGGWTPEIFHGDIKDVMMKLGYSGPMILILEPLIAFYRVHDNNSIHQISSFMASAHRLIDNERAGRYPGGAAHAFERHAALGAYIGFWSLKALAAGRWAEVLRLLVRGMPMLLAGVAQRCANRLRGVRPASSLDIDAVHFQENPAPSTVPVSHAANVNA